MDLVLRSVSRFFLIARRARQRRARNVPGSRRPQRIHEYLAIGIYDIISTNLHARLPVQGPGLRLNENSIKISLGIHIKTGTCDQPDLFDVKLTQNFLHTHASARSVHA